MRIHVEMAAAARRAGGMPEREAQTAALRSFGNATFAAEQARELWGWTWLDRLGQDLRYAFRTLN